MDESTEHGPISVPEWKQPVNVEVAEKDGPPGWQALTRAAFELNAAEFDQIVLDTPGIDPFCSSSFWILSAYEAFAEGSEALFAVHRDGMVALCQYQTTDWGRLLAPLEASWCLASGLVTANPQRFCLAVRDLLAWHAGWESVFLPGLELNGLLWRHLVGRFREWTLYGGPAAVRCRAWLHDGPEGFLARRSAKFRKNLRRANRLAQASRIRFSWQSTWNMEDAERFFKQAMECEAKSWKGLAGEGVHQGPMHAFYAAMLPRLVGRGQFRAVGAYQESEMVGYAFGGVWGNVFRGLQFSFLPDLAKVSLGNLMQWELIKHLSQEGIAIYDLGMDMPYKHQWSDDLLTTHALIVKR